MEAEYVIFQIIFTWLGFYLTKLVYSLLLIDAIVFSIDLFLNHYNCYHKKKTTATSDFSGI